MGLLTKFSGLAKHSDIDLLNQGLIKTLSDQNLTLSCARPFDLNLCTNALSDPFNVADDSNLNPLNLQMIKHTDRHI